MSKGNYALFYNSVGNDREYDADSMSEWLLPFFTTGVFNGQLQVVANDNLTVTITGGYCNIKGKVKNLETQTFDLEIASGTLNRIDNVILRRDDTKRDIYIFIQKGGNASTPVAPEITREGVVYDLKLAEIKIAAGAIKITQADITDKRMDSDVCGWVAATVKEIDFSQITAQFEKYIKLYKEEQEGSFEEWFQTIKGKLTEDIAGSLQMQINDLQQFDSDMQEKIENEVVHKSQISTSEAVTVAGEYVMDAIEKNSAIDGTMANKILNPVITRRVKIYEKTTIAAGMGAVIYFAIPVIKGYKCVLGIGGISSNSYIVPIRCSNIPESDGTMQLYYKNTADTTQTIEDLYCNMIFVKDN